MLLAILQNLKLLWIRFSPLEERLLAAVRTVLPSESQSAYDSQIASITRVQRHPRWTEIIFYRTRNGKVDWSDVTSFPCADEFRLAEVRFTAHGKNYKATMTCVSGHIAILTVAPSPKQVAFESWDGAPAVRLLDDPLRRSTGTRAAESISPKWRKFLLRHSGKALGDWVLYDESTAYRVPSNEGEHLVLAERNGDEFILQDLEGDGEAQEQLLHLRDHDGTPELIRGDLDELIKPELVQVLARKHGVAKSTSGTSLWVLAFFSVLFAAMFFYSAWISTSPLAYYIFGALCVLLAVGCLRQAWRRSSERKVGSAQSSPD